MYNTKPYVRTSVVTTSTGGGGAPGASSAIMLPYLCVHTSPCNYSDSCVYIQLHGVV